ncbi:MAG: prefoldin subunit alpha [Desulfurococcales archaeon]|nr:prefoldin subunit alpha [Desulfurococcales archaeon]
MSKKPIERKEYTIDLQAVIMRLNELRNYIAILQSQIDTLTQEISELQLTLSTIKELNKEEREVDIFVATDRLASVFVPARIKKNWNSNILVNIGKEYYIKTSTELAEKVISRKISTTQNLLRLRQQELARALNEYNYLQNLISSIAYQQESMK